MPKGLGHTDAARRKKPDINTVIQKYIPKKLACFFAFLRLLRHGEN